MNRKNIPKNKFGLFYSQMYLWAEICGIRSDPEISRALEILEDAVDSKMARTMTTKQSKTLKDTNKCRKFISIFRSKYLEMTDQEYEKKPSDKEVKNIDRLIGKLDEKDISVEEYLMWLFDVFHPNNPKIDPNPAFASCDSILQKFIYENRNMLKKRKDDKIRSMKFKNLSAEARELYRETKDEGLRELITKLRSGTMTVAEMEKNLEKFKQKK